MNQSSKLNRYAQRLFGEAMSGIGPAEQRILEQAIEGRAVSRNVHETYETEMSLGARVADKVASFGGSWPFIILFGLVLAIWISVNAVMSRTAFDPYPFILLNLVLSMLAAIQAPVIMMSQNRQADKDRLAATHDYEVNLKAELEIIALHDKLDAMRDQVLAEMPARQETLSCRFAAKSRHRIRRVSGTVGGRPPGTGFKG